MLSATPAFQAFCADIQNGTAPPNVVLAELFTINLVTVAGSFYLTNYDQDIVFNGQTYLSGQTQAPLVQRGAITTTTGLEVNTMDLTVGALPQMQINGIPILSAARQGYFDGAWVTVQRVAAYAPPTLNAPFNTTLGAINKFYGRISDIQEISRIHFTATCKSPLEMLNLQMPRNLYGPGCQWVVFDAGCGLNKEAFGVTGKITAGSTTIVLNTTLTPPPSVNPPANTPVLSQNSTNKVKVVAQTLWVAQTYVCTLGETGVGPYANISMNKNSLLTVESPPGVSNATGWNCYVGYGQGAGLLQNAIPLAIGSNWTEPASLLGAGTPPQINSNYDPGAAFGEGSPGLGVTTYYSLGHIVFTSGVLNGWSASIAYNTNSGQLSLDFLLPETPSVGDTFIAYPGCDQTFPRCVYLQGSVAQAQLRYGGQPCTPTPETGF